MDYDKDTVDDYTLALMFLVMSEDEYSSRAWKGIDLNTLNRLHEKGYIGDPKGKSASVAVTKIGREKAEKLFTRFFGKDKKS
jgi:hypothetical protein